MWHQFIPIRIIPNCFFFYMYFSVLVKSCTQEGLPTWRALVGDKILIEYEMRFTVNLTRGNSVVDPWKLDFLINFLLKFADIFEIMFEGQQFEHFGFALPSVLRTAIMKKEMLFNDFEAVSTVIDKYNSLLDKLSLSEVRYFY